MEFDLVSALMAIKQVYAIVSSIPLIFCFEMDLATLGNKLVHFVGLDPNWALILGR